MQLEDSLPVDSYDVCILGSGPAGIITALEYANLNPLKTVLLVEYGDNKKSKINNLDETIEITNPLNHHLPYECTNKGFGGTSATWGGRCVMYDKIDFMPQRSVLGDECTWDLDLFNEIDSYLSRAAFYFECGQPIFNLNTITEYSNYRIAENFEEGSITDSVLERWSMPTRFGLRYKEDIENHTNITLIEGYEARDLLVPNNDGVVSSIIIRNVNTKEIREVKSKVFVLAAGTQETTRILLRNKTLFKTLGGPPNALGKYYQGHLSGKIASVLFKGDPNKTDFGFLKDVDGTYIRRRFQFSTKFLAEHNLLNTAIWLDNPLYFDPKHGSGAMSLMYVAMIMPILGKKLAPPAIAHSITKGKVYGVPGHILNILKGFPRSVTVPVSIFYKRYLKKRKLPGVFLFSPSNQYALHFHAEQIPVLENCMELGPDGETLIINYKLTDEDISSVIKLHDFLDKWLRKNNCGELQYWFPTGNLPEAIREMSRDGIHQSGTTRIADSPKKGVVDRNLKVFGTGNVYVCSSSVFPTSGQANPTFLLGAFAVRLAKHLTSI